MQANAQRLLHPDSDSAPIAMREHAAPLSDGEVHFLFWFIQGSIMNPDTRHGLRRAWGLCRRHACSFIAVDAAFRSGWLHGPALLYADLMQRAQRAMQVRGPLWTWRLARRLRDCGPCLLCEAGLGPHSPSAGADADLLAHGRDPSAIRAYAARTRPIWGDTVCGRCVDTAAAPRCRLHLLDDLRQGSAIDLARQQALVTDIGRRAGVYAQAFRWEARGSDTLADQAALISAVGRCSGWSALLQLVEDGTAIAASETEAAIEHVDHRQTFRA